MKTNKITQDQFIRILIAKINLIESGYINIPEFIKWLKKEIKKVDEIEGEANE